MADFRFPCPSCGATLKVPDPEPSTLRCYKCGSICPVPERAVLTAPANGLPVPVPVDGRTQPVPRNGTAVPHPEPPSKALRSTHDDPDRSSPPEDRAWWARKGVLVLLAVVAGVALCTALGVVALAFHGLATGHLTLPGDDFGAEGDGPDVVIAGGGGEAEAPGEEAGALRFTGRSYVELARTRGLLDLNRSFTIELWARWSPQAHKPLYLAGDEAWPGMSPNVQVAAPCGWALRTTAPERGGRALDFTIAARSGKDAQWIRVVGAPAAESGGWQHVAVCKSPEEVRIYWNGKLHARQSCKGLRFLAAPTDLYVGVRKDAHVDRSFEGDITEFRLSSAVLYTREFRPEAGWLLVADKNDLVFLDFAHNGGELIRDASGKEHHGRIEGAGWVNPAGEP